MKIESVVIGTAGHVDHGKTCLVKALTGTDTDRLREEKARGISIELGFASFPMSDGRIAGIVDVPGHERFIHNMLAGAGGMDLVLLVVDAMEGVMPQTREHLGILELLGVQKGLVVMTKIDLVEKDWGDIVEEEIKDEVRGTFLAGAPVHRISVLTGEGIEDLKKILDQLTRELIPRDAAAPFRFPVDRNFIIDGFGTVVTGTLLQGTLRVGDIVEILPAEEQARIRNLQVFNHDVPEACAGHRVAINLSGVSKNDVERGSVICRPGYFSQTVAFDATLNMLPASPRVLQHLDLVHLYIGTARVVAKVAILDKEELAPGEKGMVQLRLEAPLVAERKDRFIIRSYSPMTTIGGGVVLDPLPGRRHRRFRDKVLQPLHELLEDLTSAGQDTAFVRQKIKQLEYADLSILEKNTRLGKDIISSILQRLAKEDRVIKLADSYVLKEVFAEWQRIIVKRLDDFHREHPLAAGLSRAEIKSVVAPGLPYKDFDAFLEKLDKEGIVVEAGDKVRKRDFSPGLSARDDAAVKKIRETLLAARFQPPSPRKLAEEVGIEANQMDKLLKYLVNCGELIYISEEIYLLEALYNEAVTVLKKHFAQKEKLSMGEYRDFLQSSRKYVQPMLEYFDQKKLTRRKEDYRVLWKGRLEV